MKPQKTETVAQGRCPVCGRSLPPQVPPSRCPHCLLRQGLSPQEAKDLTETVAATSPNPFRAWPEPGETFGHYRIVRKLGEGGMGAVFEAEDLESGRRVALKVLGHRIDSAEARSRFFREGRLAASVNHPNSVYIFGTEEIAGIPVIAMELVGGGTLQQRVTRHGPMPAAEAVDSVLQIIAGLEAAQRVGVLHRDIKPSNCFVESDGTVKIGDFGLSISTLVCTEPAITASGAFLGTPAFSSPEQLRGDELTVRADIYSLGVTLYFLLTGHHPFEATDMVRLLATVLERRPESPAKWRPGLPAGLCRIALRCLEKVPEKRYGSYAELRSALLLFASTATTPARLGLRFLAYCLDELLFILPFTAISIFFLGGTGPSQFAVPQIVMYYFYNTALRLIYFSLLEGLYGASLGKYVCRLKLARLDRTAPGVSRALLRAFIFTTIPNTVWLLGEIVGRQWVAPPLVPWTMLAGLLGLATKALMFVTARRRNGFAALHDLASATRVILPSAYQVRPVLPLRCETLPSMAALPLIGPYHVLDRLGNEDGAELLLGFDARLLRRVWVRKMPVGAAPLAASLRQVGRPGRLRWLSAKRTETEAWDAYEAASGQPLLALIRQPQDWSRVRYWLLDLANELQAANQDGTLPATLSLDHVWITCDGRAKLLDFPAPGTAGLEPRPCLSAEPTALTPVGFLRQTAMAALSGLPLQTHSPEPLRAKLPLAFHARQFLETLNSETNLKEPIADLQSLLNLPALVTRARRAALLFGALALPLLTTLIGGGYHTATVSFLRAAPETATLRECLFHHQQLVKKAKLSQGPKAEVEALEIYIAGRFVPLITNSVRWNHYKMRLVMTESLRTEAERIISTRPRPSPEAFAKSAATLERYFKKSPDVAARETIKQVTLPIIVLVVGYANAVIFVIIPCLIGSLLFRGGALVKLLGIVLVTRTGAPASRWRVMARNLVAWLPFLLSPAGTRLLIPPVGVTGALLVMTSLCAALALASVFLPTRGLADRLCGTWLVPR